MVPSTETVTIIHIELLCTEPLRLRTATLLFLPYTNLE